MSMYRWMLPPLLAGSLLVAACGSGSNQKAASPAAGGAVAGGESLSAAPTKPPTELKVSQPLAKTPPEGKSFIFLQCELPVCERYVGGFKQAASTLGATPFQTFRRISACR